MDQPKKKRARKGAVGAGQTRAEKAVLAGLQEYSRDIELAMATWTKDVSVYEEARAAAKARFRETVRCFGPLPALEESFSKIESVVRETRKAREPGRSS